MNHVLRQHNSEAEDALKQALDRQLMAWGLQPGQTLWQHLHTNAYSAVEITLQLAEERAKARLAAMVERYAATKTDYITPAIARRLDSQHGKADGGNLQDIVALSGEKSVYDIEMAMSAVLKHAGAEAVLEVLNENNRGRVIQ